MSGAMNKEGWEPETAEEKAQRLKVRLIPKLSPLEKQPTDRGCHLRRVQLRDAASDEFLLREYQLPMQSEVHMTLSEIRQPSSCPQCDLYQPEITNRRKQMNMKLDEIRKLIEAATPGPWSYRESGSCGGTVYRVSPSFTDKGAMAHADAAFIAASRTLMPKLLAVAEAANAIPASVGEEGQHGDLARALAALEAE